MTLCEQADMLVRLSTSARSLVGMRPWVETEETVRKLDAHAAELCRVCSKLADDISRQINDNASEHVAAKVADIMQRRAAS